MPKLEKYLRKNEDKPVFEITTPSNEKLTCLLDTGANVNTFHLGENALKMYFSDAVKIQGVTVDIYGFGKDGETAPLYRIPDFKIKSDTSDDCIEFKGLIVACLFKPKIKQPFLLGAPTFNKMNYEINNTKHRLYIEYFKDVYGMGYKGRSDDLSKIVKFFSFTQEL